MIHGYKLSSCVADIRQLEAAVAQVGHGKDGFECPVVSSDAGLTVLVVGPNKDIDVETCRDVEIFGVPSEDDRVDDNIAQSGTVVAPEATSHVFVYERDESVSGSVSTEDLIVGYIGKPKHIGYRIQLKIRYEIVAIVVLEL
ncbi:MAG TPA: hypothetical protein VFG29_05065 [Syntrophales bacterium]|nr:hypothetical protein [Syntrophales bacterium]